MEDIKEWFEQGQDFAKGIALLNKYNRRQLAVNLGKKEIDFHKQKMTYELGKIANISMLSVQTQTTAMAGSIPLGVLIGKASEIANKELDISKPDKVELLHKEKAEIWQRESALRNTLHEFDESDADGLALTPELQAQRQDLIDEILAYNNRRTEIEELLSVFEKTGKLPETPEEIEKKVEVMDTAALFKRRENLITYVSKENKKLKSLEENSEKWVSVKEKLAKFQFELNEINHTLNIQ